MMQRIKSFAKIVLPGPIVKILGRIAGKLRGGIMEWRGITIAPPGTDLVGYETLIDFILAHRILKVAGDFVEIGTFLGGGAYKLAKFLEKKKSLKRLFVIDIFDPGFDKTVNVDGSPMALLYSKALEVYDGKSQSEVFSEVTRTCTNIVPLTGDSKKVRIPSGSFSFAFIDGNHEPGYVENDFYLVWARISSKGVVAFHDYEGDLPQTTAKIKELIDKHAADIQDTYHYKAKSILFVVKK